MNRIVFQTSPALDELLLDIATIAELSDNDRKVAESRYRNLKTHLERPSSSYRELLLQPGALIYPQGSMSIGATIVSGTDDDRYDVDALVDVRIPSDWSPQKALDELEIALQGFPDVRKIVRCTRCVQLRFAFMHMDVTVLDPAKEPRKERVGDIFHSPDKGDSYRVASNPFGFSAWFTRSVVKPDTNFVKALQERRRKLGRNRLGAVVLAKADQEKLPEAIPPRVDAQQVVALKLLKRFVNLRFESRDERRPPSIYFTKLAVTCGYTFEGLTAQLERLAALVKSQMDEAIAKEAGPDERNPEHDEDRLNDRWPTDQADRKLLSEDMGYLLIQLQIARDAEARDILKIFDELFGERISREALSAYVSRVDQSEEMVEKRYERGTGAILGTGTVAAPAVARASAAVPSHNFHAKTKPRK